MLYQAGPRVPEFEKHEIDRMLEMDVIEPVQKDWEALLVFAPKKEGTLLFCVYYCKLDAVTVQDYYPILPMEECIDSLGLLTILST